MASNVEVKYVNLEPSVTPTITAGAYADGELIGGKMEFVIDRTDCILQTVKLYDLAKQSSDIDLVLFDADPTATTFTDAAALDVADADLVRILGFVSINDYSDFSDNSVGFRRNLAIDIKLDSDSSNIVIYGALVARGTPTYASTGDITVQLGLI